MTDALVEAGKYVVAAGGTGGGVWWLLHKIYVGKFKRIEEDMKDHVKEAKAEAAEFQKKEMCVVLQQGVHGRLDTMDSNLVTMTGKVDDLHDGINDIKLQLAPIIERINGD